MTGDKWVTCDNARKILTPEQLFKKLIYDDGAGNPVLHTSQDGTELEPFDFCAKNMTFDQVFREMILEDADGNPYLNTTSS